MWFFIVWAIIVGGLLWANYRWHRYLAQQEGSEDPDCYWANEPNFYENL